MFGTATEVQLPPLDSSTLLRADTATKMVAIVRACALLLSWVALVFAQSTESTIVVEISPVVHQSTPFSAVLRLPASLPPKVVKSGVEVVASVLDGHREEIPLATKKFVVSARGEVLLEHELEGLLIGYVTRRSRVWIFESKLCILDNI